VTADDKMSINERYQYLRRIQGRYRQATRQAKKAVLDEIVAHSRDYDDGFSLFR